MVIGVVGLGLIGGSLAKGFKTIDSNKVLGYDKDIPTVKRAELVEAIDGELNDDNIGSCDYIFIALYPKLTEEFVKKNKDRISENTVVVDCSGTKRCVCDVCFKLAHENGFRFVGGHPMAGTHFSGFKYSRASLFDNASMILVPDKDEKLETLAYLKNLLVSIGFKSITITNPDEHDRIIAFTSQLAHVVSSAYVKSPNARVHKGFSAGSYRDLTRVAKLNSKMWAELFIENKDNICFELDTMITQLTKYKDAINDEDTATLEALLDEGTKIKESIDKNA